MAGDLNREASELWNSLKPIIDKEIDARTQGVVQRRKAKVTTAPSLVTNTIGVTEPFGTEMFLPFNTNIMSASVGDFVWVEYMYGMTNAFVSMFASADEKDWDVAGDLSVGGDAGISGNLDVSGSTSLQNTTVNGVLDITPRRCYATLSSAGWYRVVTFDVRHTGSVIEFYIGRPAPSGTPAENHKISFFMNGGGLSSFVDETSRTSTVLIDKIRLNYVGYTGYIDIHYTSSSTNDVLVYFNVYGKLQQAGTTVSMGLVSVADSPSGENQGLLYTFAANTVYHDEAKVSGLTHVIDRVGNVVTVTLHAEGQATYCTSNTQTTIYTIPSGYRPKSDVYFIADAYGANLLISGTAKSDGSVVLIPINADASWYRMTFTYIV